MHNQDWEFFNKHKVGIVGCGHLGQSIAQSLISHGLAKENLLVSYRGNPLTYQRLEMKGLSSCLTENQRLFREAGVILITLKPQDILELKELPACNQSLMISCMAGVPTKLLNEIFGKAIYRMMFSGPDTISSGKGVATFYPQHEHLKLLPGLLNLKYIQIDREEDIDVFTAGVCIPAAILKLEDSNQGPGAVERIEAGYPLLSELYEWSLHSLPRFQNSMERNAYIGKMITKGGITEAIINSLQKGEALDASLRKGIDRAKEISIEIQKSMMVLRRE